MLMLMLSMRNVRDYYPPKDYHRVATLTSPCRVISSGRKSLYERHTASTVAYSVKMAALFSAINRFAL